METMVEQFFAVGADQARSKFDAMCQVFFKKFEAYTPSAQMPAKKGGRRNSEDEQEQDKASQQLALSASGGCNERTPASSLELDLCRVRVHLVFAEEQGSQAQQRMNEKDLHQTPQVGFPWKRMLRWETCEGERVEGTFRKEEKEKEKQLG